MAQSKLFENNELPSTESLVARFEFIEEPNITLNLATTLGYVIFLVKLANTYQLPDAVKHLIYKDIIIHTASIVECVLNYTLQRLSKRSPQLLSKIVSTTPVYKSMKTIYSIKEGVSVVAGICSKKTNPLRDSTAFKQTNVIAKDIGVYNDDLFKMSEELREKRNRVHLVGLSSRDNSYSEKEVDTVFQQVKLLLNCLETRLNMPS